MTIKTKIRKATRIVILIGIFLIVIGFFLPGLGKEPVPLGALLLALSKYTLGVFHLIAVLATMLFLFLRFKRVIYWIALSTTLLSFCVQLVYSVWGKLFIQIMSGRGSSVLILSIGQISVLAGLILYKVRGLKRRFRISSSWKYLLLPGIGLLVLLVGLFLVGVILLMLSFLK